MFRASPRTLFDATAAGSSLSGLLWPATGPGSFTTTLPPKEQIGTISPILTSTSVCGAVFAPSARDCAVLLDFCAVGTAEQALVIEIGKLHTVGAIAMPLASVSITSSTQTVANVNPYTGVAIATTTYRLFDTAAITAKSGTDAIITSLGGGTDDTPTQFTLMCDDATYYYAIITTLPGGLTEVICVMTPTAINRVLTKALA
jgi:hypothetical protein